MRLGAAWQKIASSDTSLALRYGDWKIAERLQDDGACPRLRRGDQPDSVHDGITLGLAFAEDMKGRMRPGLRAVQQLYVTGLQ
jgi:hypothetical protein